VILLHHFGMQSYRAKKLYTLFQKSDDIFNFGNSVKIKPILTIFGMQNPEKIGNKRL